METVKERVIEQFAQHGFPRDCSEKIDLDYEIELIDALIWVTQADIRLARHELALERKGGKPELDLLMDYGRIVDMQRKLAHLQRLKEANELLKKST